MLRRALSCSCRRFLSSLSGTRALRSPNEADIDHLFEGMNRREGSVIVDSDILDRYNTDWTLHYKGSSKVAVRPRTTEEVSAILSYCNDQRIGVVPQAGNTGLVGGSVPVKDELVLSVEAMNQIYNLDETSGILTCDGGCILQTLHDYADSRDHLLPVDLGAKGTCMIAGNISTNAGGQYYYRFGSLHANILGLEIVLPNGKIMNLLNVNRKDNTGYDLKHLFIGAEGTLGVVTKVALSCLRKLSSRNVAFLACETFEAVTRTLIAAKSSLGETLAAFEFMDKGVLDLVMKEKNLPIVGENGESFPFCVLVETQGSNDSHDKDKMEQFLENCMTSGEVIDGVLSHDLSQVANMWEIRESTNPIVKSAGYNYKYDLSLPLESFYEIVLEMRTRISEHPHAQVVNWGHIVDGNLHLNITTPGQFDEDPALTQLIEPFVYESVIKRGGSISAEHGLGQCKNEYLKLAKDPVALEVMHEVKSLFDPNGIMNPGKYLPSRA